MLQTEFAFILPCGYIDAQGNMHRQGVMRRATALDEIEALGHPRARANEAYTTILLISRVVLRLGSLSQVGPSEIEALFSTDFAYLQNLFLEINSSAPNLIATQCPVCGTRMVLDANNAEKTE